ncbi:hypothetical protein Pyn_05152 [Prunus yedoensis var. nudiflora]|uniref:Uncharacterized protein n=1 Tax=Prunus yedoensis var. nudiflora TaxID=2094558 RepID=A0A314YVA0_PRUYE|nr:hypothetical protein Pyn_05152 [Prunus yedoensis var. nudiflora]
MRTNQEDRSRHKICPNLELINKQNPGYPETDFALGTDSDQKEMNPTQEQVENSTINDGYEEE